MATTHKKAAKPSSNAKPTSVSKKAAPAKKAVAKNANVKAKPVAKKAAAPAKKPAQPVPAKKTPAKNAPAKKVVPAKKAAPAKKSAPVKNSAPNNNQKTVNKKNSKAAPPAKKSAPVKKTAPVKKAAPVAKAPVAKPAAKAPAKPAPKAPVKPVASTPAKPVAKAPVAAPAAKPAKPAASAPVQEPVAVAKKAPQKKKITLTQVPVKVNPSAPRPMATPAARSTEKKPNVIIAHRRMENKAKEAKESGNTMIHYQPETYRSILDEPQQVQGPVYRYSDEDLNEFKEIITSRLDAARKELLYLQGLITRKDEAGTEDTENRYMNMEDGSGAMEREQLAQLASRQIQFINHLEKALVRIENKTYGICRVTGKLIDKARLRAVPHATLSIEAKKMMASKQN
jgi:RNA polymerase-binding transcription factor DksA